MGFDEMAQSSNRMNRSLIKSTVTKYFRNKTGIAMKAKTELSESRLKVAEGNRNRKVRGTYVMLLCIIVLIVVCVFLLM